MNEGDEDAKKIQCLQLLFLLIPESNYALLRDLLKLLALVTQQAEHNKMNAANLATVFATHILCPRSLTADCLQSKHQLFIKAVTFMIEHTDELFTVPSQLIKDVDMFWKSNSERDLSNAKPSLGHNHSPVVNTIYSFVDREKTKEASMKSTTETALAELYAQVQSMPESAQKRRLISKLNDANGCGTPSVSTKKKKKGSEASKLRYLLTPKSKGAKHQKEGKNHGSYNVDSQAKVVGEILATPPSSYKRQDSRGNSSMVTFSDASPVLKDADKPPKPAPPPRISSLKKSEVKSPKVKDSLETPRCRKPLMTLSPMIELSSPPDASSSPAATAANIEEEARRLLTGEINPSESMTYFLEGGQGSPGAGVG